MTIPKRSVSEIHPHRHEIPALIAVSVSLLLAGLSLPIVTVQKKILWKTVENTYSVAAGVRDLAQQGDYVLSAVVFLFSMIFPFVKLFALWFLWSVKLTDRQREQVLRWLGNLGKWSMLDVFAVAILVVLAKLRTLTVVEPRVGIYFFGSAIFLSMATAMYMDWLTAPTRRLSRGSH